MPSESFSEMSARIAREPAHRKVEVPKIALDMSMQGILNRVHALMEAAHESGDLPADEYQKVHAAMQTVKGVLSRHDERQLMTKLRTRTDIKRLIVPKHG